MASIEADRRSGIKAKGALQESAMADSGSYVGTEVERGRCESQVWP